MKILTLSEKRKKIAEALNANKKAAELGPNDVEAHRSHSAVYNGGEDRVMIGINFYAL